MSPQLRMLLWKEWRERRTQFLVCLLWIVGGAVYNVAYAWSRETRTPVASFFSTILLFELFAPIFVAMRTSLGETTDRTRSFTNALPISAQRRGWIRLAGGAAALIVPILVGAVLISLCLGSGWIEQVPPRPPFGHTDVPRPLQESLSALSAVALVWRATTVLVFSTVEFYVLLSLVGTALRAEAHAGFAGAAIGVLWFLSYYLGIISVGLPGVTALFGAINPQSMIGAGSNLWILCGMGGPLLGNTLVQIALATWFVRRYSRILPSRAMEAVRHAPGAGWRRWSLPLPNRSIALIWLPLRQAVPMCLPGLLLACLMTPLFMMEMLYNHHRGGWLQEFADRLPSSMWAIGLLWAVVVGSGIFAAEVDWRVGDFWRTRPIPFWRFFAAKFFIGLLAVLVVLDATTIAVSWNSPNWGTYWSMNWPYIACLVPLHAVMFAVPVAWTCVLRRPVFGGLAAVICFMLMEISIESWEAVRQFEPLEVYKHFADRSGSAGGAVDLTAHGYPVLAAAMGVVFLASIVVAGLALRRYDPRRRSG